MSRLNNGAASKPKNGKEKEKVQKPPTVAVVLKNEPTEDVVFVSETHNHDDDICELEHLRKLFVGGLAPYTTEESLKAFYEQWGKVVDVVVMRDLTTKRSRGFGFITYTKAFMVDRAQENRPHIIDGKAVEAKRALARPEREKRELNISVKKLFVGGLKDNHDEECLTEYFSEFGKVVSVKILTDKTTGKRRGFAFIEYDDYDAVDKAILQKHHSIKYVVVDVKKSVYAQEKQNRQNAALAASNNNQMPNNLKGGPAMQGPPQPAYGPQAVPPRQYAPPPMNNGPPPPQNYNYWGPAPQQPPPPQYYGGYPQQPPAPQMGGWGYPAPPQNQWNAGPPVPPGPPVQPGPPGPPPQANWQQPQGQWGPPPPAGPPAVGPPQPPAWNTAPPTAAPNGPSAAGPPVAPPQAPDFGAGYQQNYGGGPTKNGNMSSNRMNPYGTSPRYGYAGPPGVGNGPPGVGAPQSNNNVGPGPKPVPPVGNVNRRY